MGFLSFAHLFASFLISFPFFAPSSVSRGVAASQTFKCACRDGGREGEALRNPDYFLTIAFSAFRCLVAKHALAV